MNRRSFSPRCMAMHALHLTVLAVCGCSPAPEETSKASKTQSTTGGGPPTKATCVVASVNPLATDAGVAAFEAGGNAVDAAIATALTLGVVDGYNSGIGGGCFILIRRADGTVAAIDGREIAPAAATRDMYLVDGKADPEKSRTGALAVGVPGAVAAYQLALEKYGRRALADALLPAAKLAEKGFEIPELYEQRLDGEKENLLKFAGTRAVFCDADRAVWKKGHVLKQRDLATTYRTIAEEGPGWFYTGKFAERVGEWMAANHGILTAADFAAYMPIEREPLKTTYRGYTIIGFPPPSSGGVHVAEMLNILERFDLRKVYQQDPVRALHILAEAMKLAFADRAHWLGDPDFVAVPRGLIDKQYAAELAKRINPDHTIEVLSHGTPPGASEDFFKPKHTTHITAADSDGNWVSITATINTTFGSKVVVPGTGVVLNNEMDDFSAQPGAPNAFELVGAESNSIAPGKRPLSSMSPTIVLKDGKPVMTVGAAGGPKIITQALLAIVRRLDFQQTLAEAVGSPRIHHQWKPDDLFVERTLPKAAREELKKLGHKLRRTTQVGATQAIEIDGSGKLLGVAESRVGGKAARGER